MKHYFREVMQQSVESVQAIGNSVQLSYMKKSAEDFMDNYVKREERCN